VKRNQKEQLAQMKAQPKAMKKPARVQEKQAVKKSSGWRSFLDRYCSL